MPPENLEDELMQILERSVKSRLVPITCYDYGNFRQQLEMEELAGAQTKELESFREKQRLQAELIREKHRQQLEAYRQRVLAKRQAAKTSTSTTAVTPATTLASPDVKNTEQSVDLPRRKSSCPPIGTNLIYSSTGTGIGQPSVGGSTPFQLDLPPN